MPEVEIEEPASSEVDRIVAAAARTARAEEEDEPEPDEEPPRDVEPGEDREPANERPEPEPKKRKLRGAAVSKAERAAAEGRSITAEEREARDMVPKDLPEVVENEKTLGDLMAKYNIGQDPEFKAWVSRSWPKVFPGGVKADGFYDSWDQPLSNELLQSEYGGGTYRIAIMGPNPKNSQVPKHYDGITINYPGEPNYDRMPKAMQARQGREADYGAMPPPMAVPAGEHPKITEVVLGAMTDIVKGERDERRRMEDRAEKEATTGQAGVQPVVEAERRRADELIAAEKRLSQTERENLAQQLSAERTRFAVLEQKIEEMRMEAQSRPSTTAEMKELLSMPQFSGGGAQVAAAASERMVESMMTKHGEELKRMAEQNALAMSTVQTQHQASVDAMRQAHQSELASLREAGRRDIEAEKDSARRQLESERESAKRREERAEDQLKTEREERRRDQELARKQLDERDIQWKDRMENQKQMIDTSWDARHSTTISGYESRALTLQGDIDRLKEELREAKTRVNEQNDPLTQITRARELKEAIVGSEPGAGGSGGITPPESGGDWKAIAMQEVGDKLPDILQTIGNIFSGKSGGDQQQQQQAPQQQQPLQPGQIVQTPQGEMVVVNTPQGLRLAPRAQFEQYMAEQQQRGGTRTRGMAPMAGGAAAGRRKKDTGHGRSVVPNLASSKYGSAPLAKQKAPWEDDDEEAAPVQEEAPRAPRGRTVVTPPPQPQDQQPQAAPQPQGPALTEQEKTGLGMLAKFVHESVMQADEPEEFVQKVMSKYPAEVLKQVIGRYTPEQIAYGIVQLAPRSAGATPGGQQFVRQAFVALARALEAT